MDKKVSELLNAQINKEFYSAYLYLDFANYFERRGLSGFAHWYEVQAQEERDHAMLFLGSGTPVLLFQLEQGTDSFDVPGEFLFGASDTQIIIRDVEVPGKFKCGSFRFNCIQSR